MRMPLTKRRVILLSFAALLLVLSIAVAAVPLFDLSWWTVDAGGSLNMNGGAYSLSGTTGQPDTVKMTGGEYALQGGFWAVGPAGATGAKQWEGYQ